MAALAGLVWASGPTGCAYYNGMYNTRRYAGRAERSERAGRTSEAADRWRQVVVHADTLLARHPRSRWADDAELLKGRALVALRAWAQAVTVLESAAGRAGTEEQRRQAQYWLALAHAGRGAYGPALANFDSALASPGREQQQLVRLARGRTLLLMGRPADALRDFEAVSLPAARFERAQAALALGRPDAAAAYADSAVGAAGVKPEAWAALLDSIGRQGGAAEASRLVDRLAQRAISSGARARLLLADGDRWAAQGDDSAARVRWDAAARAAPDSAEARAAEGRELRMALRGPDAAQRLATARVRLGAISSGGGEPAREARDVLRVLELVDSVAQTGGQSDARAFQAAAWLRDSLSAPALAADRFAAMASEWPTSPWAPKALVAAIAAGHPAADSLRQVLRERYGASPYASGVTGEEPDAALYAALEDSLRTALEDAPLGAQRGASPGAAAAAALEAADADDRMLAERTSERAMRQQAAAAAAAPRAPVRTARERPAALPRNPEP